MHGLIVFEMNKDYKCISKSLYLGFKQVNVFIEHMTKYTHNRDQCVVITEQIKQGLDTIKFSHTKDWNKEAEEALATFSVGNMLVSRLVPICTRISHELINDICKGIAESDLDNVKE